MKNKRGMDTLANPNGDVADGGAQRQQDADLLRVFGKHNEERVPDNSSDKMAAYVQGLSDVSASVRLKSVKAIAKNRAVIAVLPLSKLLCDTSPRVRAEVAAILSGLGVLAVPGLIMALVRVQDIKAFRKVVDLLLVGPAGFACGPLINVMLSHAGPAFRAVAIQAMRHFSGERVTEALEQSAAEDPSPANRASAAKMLRLVKTRPVQGNTVQDVGGQR